MLTVILISLTTELVKMSISTNYEMNLNYFIVPLYLLVINTSCFIVSFVLMVLVIARLAKKGTSGQLRYVISVRYISAYFFFLLQYWAVIVMNINEIRYQSKVYLIPKQMLYMLIISVLAIPIIRISEPLIFSVVRSSITKTCQMSRKKK